jgi:DNA-binding beta-propeller fold protein YncE
LKLKAAWPLAPCEEPSGLAIDAAAHRLFAVCSNKMMAIVDSDSGKVLATPAIGDHPDAAAVDADNRLAFSSNGEGTLTAVQADAPYAVVDTITTQKGARTLAVDPVGHRVFVVTSEFGAVSAKDASSHGRAPAIPGTFTLLSYGLETPAP